jgi:putative addiction module killer protein
VIEVEVRETEFFAGWLRSLRDPRARARIRIRIDRLQLGLAGDIRPVGGGVSELRIDYGPGYRVYVLSQGTRLVVLLAGGDKNSQARDIPHALRLAKAIREQR